MDWLERFKIKLEKARGEGQGQGGDRQGDGGVDMCYCPVCKKDVPHEKGTPCVEMSCPDCGGKLEPKEGA